MFISHEEDRAYAYQRAMIKNGLKNKAKTLNSRLMQFLDSLYKNPSLSDKEKAEIKAELLKHIV